MAHKKTWCNRDDRNTLSGMFISKAGYELHKMQEIESELLSDTLTQEEKETLEEVLKDHDVARGYLRDLALATTFNGLFPPEPDSD